MYIGQIMWIKNFTLIAILCMESENVHLNLKNAQVARIALTASETTGQLLLFCYTFLDYGWKQGPCKSIKRYRNLTQHGLYSAIQTLYKLAFFTSTSEYIFKRRFATVAVYLSSTRIECFPRWNKATINYEWHQTCSKVTRNFAA